MVPIRHAVNFLSTVRIAIVTYTRLFISKRALSRLLSTLLCSIIISIRPFSRLGGFYPFLALSLKELVFSVQENLAQQLELTVLNIMGALLGIGLSTLSKFGASRTPLDSASGRAICAVTLIVISFFAGLIKSRLPRLQLSTRISCFVSVWILTMNIGVPHRVLPDSGAFLWITLCAAIICLFSLVAVMLPFRWVSTNFEHDIACSFAALQQCLSISLSSNFSGGIPSLAEREAYNALQARMLTTSIKLNENYSQAAFELRTGYLSLRSIRPLITTIEHVRRELAWGMPLKKPPDLRNNMKSPVRTEHSPSDVFKAIIGPTAHNLGSAVLESMRAVEATVVLAFHRNDVSVARLPPYFSEEKDSSWHAAQLSAIQEAQMQLGVATEESQDKLGLLYKDVEMGNETPRMEVPSRSQRTFTTAAWLWWRYSRWLRRWWQHCTSPNVSSSFAWSPALVSDDPAAKLSVNLALDQHMIQTSDAIHLSENERRQGLAEYAKGLAKRRKREKDMASLHSAEGKSRWSIGWMWCRFTSSLHWLWMNSGMLDLRIRLWMLHRSLKNSHHLQHALKNAVGVTILSFPAFLPSTSAGFRWYQAWHGQWMTISYLWVLETNTGATWRTGYLRILGTVIGAIYAYVVWAICRVNPYGLVVLITTADIPITWLITKTNLTPLAVPCSVAIPPIVFARYVDPGMTQPIIDLTLLRALMITAGMVAALLMNSLVWPRHCRVLFLSHTSKTFGLLSSLYLTLSHEMFISRNTWVVDDRRRTLKLEFQTRNELYRLSALITTMQDELGLLPKPIRHYRKVVLNMQKALDLLTGLRKIRENIPRQETVIDVFTERRAFMSCICILLFACQHAFRTREPLPQFLPSARHALDTLEHHMHNCLRKAPRDDARAFGVQLGYVFAEQETMRNMVETLEKLLELSGELFGTSAWLTQDAAWSTSTMADEGNDGWYSTLKWDDV
ncbi:hypothetical protein EIP91_012169 [Steccherinum ochraceum]|uniref:Integral membrane bound transporter domain-containing protein n=1 Tax=Steccherinum ochraceum TaxID=92696 RepID=A0A4R0RQJ0_9APHY|nr:hypothetical protein EIP91_012169 [Steccherinum ochraceum]